MPDREFVVHRLPPSVSAASAERRHPLTLTDRERELVELFREMQLGMPRQFAGRTDRLHRIEIFRHGDDVTVDVTRRTR